VNCRRRPRRKRCPGNIRTVVDVDHDEISWACPVCRDSGIISKWKGSQWDRSGEWTAQ
jgi:uncharacterized protein with PIN domain